MIAINPVRYGDMDWDTLNIEAVGLREQLQLLGLSEINSRISGGLDFGLDVIVGLTIGEVAAAAKIPWRVVTAIELMYAAGDIPPQYEERRDTINEILENY
jgi:hypothetical protein